MPDGPFGISSRKWTSAGTLKSARWARQWAIRSSADGAGTVARDDEAHDPLAVLGIGRPDRRRVPDGRVAVQHLVDLAGHDVLAAADDDVLLAIGDVHVAVGVDVADVARVEPAVGERRGGLLRPLLVAGHHVLAAQADLARGADADRLVVLVEDRELVADRDADRADPPVAVVLAEAPDAGRRMRIERRVAGRLGEAVALDDEELEPALEGALDLDRQWGGAADREAQPVAREASPVALLGRPVDEDARGSWARH